MLLFSLNPVDWFKAIFSDSIIAGQFRHLLAFVTTILIAKYGLSTDDATQWIESTMKLLPALIAAAGSWKSKT